MSRPIDAELLDSLVSQAVQAPRRRQHYNLHQSYSDPCQRFLNALMMDSYIRPHRHSASARVETLIAIRGSIGVLIFDDRGQVTESIAIGGSNLEPGRSFAVEIAPDEWHTAFALCDGAVLLEVKAGPFDFTAAKEFAAWAPDEGTPQAASYLERLRNVATES